MSSSQSSSQDQYHQITSLDQAVTSTRNMRHGKICESQSQMLYILQTANCRRCKVLLCSNPAFIPEAPPFSTKQQRVGIFNKRHCICVFFFVPLAYMYPQLNHIFAAHCEIFIGKSKWAGRQLARASFLVVSRYNLDISRFDLDHNLPNICFKYNGPDFLECHS